MMVPGAQAALYATIWLALALFAAGQVGLRAAERGSRWRALWWLSCAGAVLCVVHMAVALAAVHGWSHDAAVQAVAVQTQQVYGVQWPWGVYVNYAFVAVWSLELFWWRAHASSGPSRSALTTALVRVFYAAIVVNAAVVFASPTRRPAGLLLVAVLVWAWRPSAWRVPRERASQISRRSA